MDLAKQIFHFWKLQIGFSVKSLHRGIEYMNTQIAFPNTLTHYLFRIPVDWTWTMAQSSYSFDQNPEVPSHLCQVWSSITPQTVMLGGILPSIQHGHGLWARNLPLPYWLMNGAEVFWYIEILMNINEYVCCGTTATEVDEWPSFMCVE